MNCFTKYLQEQLERFSMNKISPLFKRAVLRKYLGIENIKNSFKDFPSNFTRLRSDVEGDGQVSPLCRTKSPHDIFINLDGSVEIALRSRKPKAVAVVKRLSKKGVGKIQEEHQQPLKKKIIKYKPLSIKMRNISNALKKKIQQLHCLMMI